MSNIKIVRNLTANATHLMNVVDTHRGVSHGVGYDRPDRGSALCGRLIDDGVVMREGTKVRCRVCRFLDEHDLAEKVAEAGIGHAEDVEVPRDLVDGFSQMRD